MAFREVQAPKFPLQAEDLKKLDLAAEDALQCQARLATWSWLGFNELDHVGQSIENVCYR